jgi:hypothetical protein
LDLQQPLRDLLIHPPLPIPLSNGPKIQPSLKNIHEPPLNSLIPLSSRILFNELQDGSGRSCAASHPSQSVLQATKGYATLLSASFSFSLPISQNSRDPQELVSPFAAATIANPDRASPASLTRPPHSPPRGLSRPLRQRHHDPEHPPERWPSPLLVRKPSQWIAPPIQPLIQRPQRRRLQHEIEMGRGEPLSHRAGEEFHDEDR